MELYSVFVTGANRGIGLECVRQLVRLPTPPKYVFATYRTRDGIEPLQNIRDSSKKSQVLLIKMDITRKNEIEAARRIVADMVGDRGLTLLINNAGVKADQAFPKITEENLLYQFKTNAIGPVMVLQELLPLLNKAAEVNGSGSAMRVNRAAVLNIGSALSSNNPPEWLAEIAQRCPGYCISKASLNMAMRVIAASVKSKGILVVLICPGWVKTDMGTPDAQLEASESISTIFNTLTKLTEDHHGTFMDRYGEPCQF